MSWVVLAIGAAAVVGAVTVLRRGGRVRRYSDMTAHSRHPHPGAERAERPHRHVAHYRASGALPRWDP